MIVPRLCVLAMGWTHALYWCQRVLEEAALHSSLLTHDNQLVDFKRGPDVLNSVAHTEYVDNC
eukprot:7374281-Lingulodinium_polyedra.AAC.1